MIKINDNYCKLSPSYLFTEIAHRVQKFKDENPDADIIRMGIGDVTRPICQAATTAMHEAVDEQSKSSSFHGYGPEQGYGFLREAIAFNDYQSRGIDISPDEIFISDGAKSDTGNFGDILSNDCRVAVTDPVYPVYVDSNVMSGRAGNLSTDGKWDRLTYLPCSAENDFVPSLPTVDVDVVYLCFPNNPTGTTLTKAQLQKWVDYALENNVLILFDSAYEAYITEPDVPHSIYELEGAKKVAVEFRSFSKTAGFTGLRCGYTVVPKELFGLNSAGERVSLRNLWNRRQCTKFNGASYIIQRGAAALYTPHGKVQVRETIDYYLQNAKIMLEGLTACGFQAFGGINSPYIWIKTPDGLSSWQFFDFLLNKYNIVGTPGSGFGPHGEGYFRLTAFNTHEKTREAIERLR